MYVVVFLKVGSIFMTVFIVLWSYLLTITLSCLQKITLGTLSFVLLYCLTTTYHNEEDISRLDVEKSLNTHTYKTRHKLYTAAAISCYLARKDLL